MEMEKTTVEAYNLAKACEAWLDAPDHLNGPEYDEMVRAIRDAAKAVIGNSTRISTGGLGVIVAAIADEAGGEIVFGLDTYQRIYESLDEYKLEAEEMDHEGVVRVRRLTTPDPEATNG